MPSSHHINDALPIDEEFMYNAEQEDVDEVDEDEGEEEEKEEAKSTKKSKKKSKKDKVEPPIINLLNAELRGLACGCQPFIDQFQNFKSGEQSIHMYE